MAHLRTVKAVPASGQLAEQFQLDADHLQADNPQRSQENVSVSKQVKNGVKQRKTSLSNEHDSNVKRIGPKLRSSQIQQVKHHYNLGRHAKGKNDGSKLIENVQDNQRKAAQTGNCRLLFNELAAFLLNQHTVQQLKNVGVIFCFQRKVQTMENIGRKKTESGYKEIDLSLETSHCCVVAVNYNFQLTKSPEVLIEKIDRL